MLLHCKHSSDFRYLIVLISRDSNVLQYSLAIQFSFLAYLFIFYFLKSGFILLKLNIYIYIIRAGPILRVGHKKVFLAFTLVSWNMLLLGALSCFHARIWTTLRLPCGKPCKETAWICLKITSRKMPMERRVETSHPCQVLPIVQISVQKWMIFVVLNHFVLGWLTEWQCINETIYLLIQHLSSM